MAAVQGATSCVSDSNRKGGLIGAEGRSFGIRLPMAGRSLQIQNRGEGNPVVVCRNLIVCVDR